MNETQDHGANEARAHAEPARRRVLLVVAGVAVIVAGAGAGALLALRDADDGVLAVDPAPVVLPVPTPTIEPVERERTTAFQRALPDAVLAFAVSAQEEATDLLDAGAVEAYRLTYTDGAVGIVLAASQWRTVEGARAAAHDLAQGSESPQGAESTDSDTLPPEPIREGPVLVAGVEAGRVLITGTASTARAVWTNGATLFHVEGPTAVVVSFYDAFPM